MSLWWQASPRGCWYGGADAAVDGALGLRARVARHSGDLRGAGRDERGAGGGAAGCAVSYAQAIEMVGPNECDACGVFTSVYYAVNNVGNLCPACFEEGRE